MSTLSSIPWQSGLSRIVQTSLMQQHKRTWKFTAQEKNRLVSAYRAGSSSEKIAEQHHVNAAGIRKLLKRHGVTLRTISETRQRLPLCEEAFDHLTPESAYWIGFLWGDGCVQDTRIQLSLTIGDMEHIRKFLEFLETGRRITISPPRSGSFANSQPTASVGIRSARLVSALRGYGLLHPKTRRKVAPPRLAENRDFWRGLIDADGGISIKSRKNRPTPLARLSLAGSKPMLEQFMAFVGGRGGISRGRGIFYWNASGNRLVEGVLHRLYDDASVALERKLAAINHIPHGG